MKTLADPDNALAEGLAAIRTQFQVPAAFPPEVLAAADEAAKRPPTAHIDRTDRRFVTLDPATSTDLDQAFAIERGGNDLLLHYAIADVAWFVDDDGAIDREAWLRGETLYLPDGRAGLYPPVLAEGAASLLPDGPRPAIVFIVRVAPDGTAKLDGVERVIVRSTAKLAYDRVQAADLPDGFAEIARRIHTDEARRGAARVDPPEQEVEAVDGALKLRFRPRLASEDDNAALSLATNLAVADALKAHHTGLFRVMAAPSKPAVARLRHTATAFGLDWPAAVSLDAFSRTLDATKPKHAAFMLAIRRAGDGASYAPYREGVVPWHAAVAATYAQATAPLRRLADRYVIRAALAVANGQAVPEVVTAAFGRLPPVMARADAKGGQIDRAVIDLAEAVMLTGREGETFAAIVTDTDDRGARIQLCDHPVVARVAAANVAPGDALTVRLTSVDTTKRVITFERMGQVSGDSIVASQANRRYTPVENGDSVMADFTGDGGDNVINGTPGDDTVNGNGGNDTIRGRGGADLLDGGDGDDTLDGGAGNDILRGGGSGMDIQHGGKGDDAIVVDRASDIVADELYDGGDGDDILYLNFNTDGDISAVTLTGIEELNQSYFGYDTKITAEQLLGLKRLSGQSFTLVTAGDVSLSGIAFNGTTFNLANAANRFDLTGSTHGYLLTVNGGSGKDTITGDATANALNGGHGNDRLLGNGGTDTLEGGAGNDFLSGGDDIDTATYASATTGVIVSLNETGPQDTIGAGSDTLRRIENLTGSAHDDQLTGRTGRNVLDGGDGADTLHGLSGLDKLFGGVGTDTLDGGMGKDELTGGADADRFVFLTGETRASKGSADRILDFSQAEHDRIDLSAIDANTATPAPDGFSFIAGAAFSHTAGELRYGFIGTDTLVEADTDGDGTADLAIRLTGNIVLTATDFGLDGDGEGAAIGVAPHHVFVGFVPLAPEIPAMLHLV